MNNYKDISSFNKYDKEFFNINKNEEFLLKLKKSFIKSIKGLFIYADKEKDLVIFYGNNRDVLGYDDEFIIMTFDEVKKYIHKDYIDTLVQDLRRNTEEFEIKLVNNFEEEHWVSVKGFSKLDSEGKLLKFEGYIHNITNEKEATLILEYVSSYDEVTGLNNKKHFKNITEKILKSLSILESRGVLILVNIDNFRFINDTYGHNCGDIFLKKFSDDLKKLFNFNEVLCRFAGDEFLLFIPYIDNLKDIKDIIKKIKGILKSPYNINGKKIFTSASIGITFFPDDGESFEVLLKNADVAMYRAKSNGKNQWQMFNSNISREINRIYSIQRGLRTALDNNEMFVVFQPKITLRDDEVNGFEALLRWKSCEIGVVSPGEFIPVAESTRLIIPIGKFVLREVFKKVKYLILQGYDDFKIAVNLSEIQLREGDFVEYLNLLIDEFDVSPRYIEIEITESMIMKSVDRNIEYLLELKKLGASIALDDFGTGYSSFNHLTKLPIDVLKLDRSFIVDMIDNHKSRYVIENMILLSHKLGITVVAEGVEDKEQVEYLKSIECDAIQGYYYSKPEDFENVINMLNKYNNN
ncbi:sensor domain-containing protein [Clostridium nigeriense]|uniref:sensor domain-containing protein n=1 Tax=Clostridium nigeriense TaxID=1805470 RepID=UPI003D332238